MKKLFLFILFCAPAFGAFNATAKWDVRTTGSDGNSGAFDPGVVAPGTNEAMANSGTSVTVTIGGTTTQGTSSPAISATTHGPGNFINITGGSGCTVQTVEILSQTVGVATFDKSLGTAASTCTGVLGGGKQTIQAANTLAAAGNTIEIQTGTYTFTTTMTVSQATLTYSGYNTTWDDLPAANPNVTTNNPLVTTSTNSTNLISTGALNTGTISFVNVSFSNTASTRAFLISEPSTHGTALGWVFRNSIIDGFTTALMSDNTSVDDVGFISLINSVCKNNSTACVATSSNVALLYAYGSTFSANASDIAQGQGCLMTVLDHNIFSGSTGVGAGLGPANSQGVVVTNNTFYGSAGTALSINKISNVSVVTNNLFYNNHQAIVSTNSTTAQNAAMNGCNAYGNNTLANSFWPANPGDVTLTASPFTNAAGGDFTLNSTSGGGAAVKSAGCATAGGLAIGALQPVSSGGGQVGYASVQ